jgi:hypothetical protein
LLRSLFVQLHPSTSIRINAIAPSWTATSIVPNEVIAALGQGNYQSADVVGRSVVLLMADKERHGELIFSECGKFTDMENGERGFHAMTMKMLGMNMREELPITDILKKIMISN